jgi:hypothetical protein
VTNIDFMAEAPELARQKSRAKSAGSRKKNVRRGKITPAGSD